MIPMSPQLLAYLAGGGAVLAGVTLMWLLSVRLRDAGIVDVFWSLGFVLAAWIYRGFGPPATWRHGLVLALVTIWGLRLAAHIFWRQRGHAEDYRYQAMREKAGAGFWWKSYFRVFLLQGILLWIISAPLHAAQASPPGGFRWTDALGLGLWSVGFFFEAVGDYQLARFKSRPENRGKALTSGLWATTRHPNYFGDATLWWGFFCFALASPLGWWTLPSVVLMSFLLLEVSGVALLEKTIAERREGYREYVETTPAFVPWGLLGWRRKPPSDR
jgi:steroid 5-alpha reductase family enzyme